MECYLNIIGEIVINDEKVSLFSSTQIGPQQLSAMAMVTEYEREKSCLQPNEYIVQIRDPVRKQNCPRQISHCGSIETYQLQEMLQVPGPGGTSVSSTVLKPNVLHCKNVLTYAKK